MNNRSLTSGPLNGLREEERVVRKSFDRLWIRHLLFLQAAIIVVGAEESKWAYPWQVLRNRDTRFRVLSVFITRAGLRLFQSLLDFFTQYGLVSSETRRLGLRMVLKSVVAAVWTATFVVIYGLVWRGSSKAEVMQKVFLIAAPVYLLPQVLLAKVLLVLPWVQNFLEETNWRIFNVVTETRIFVGRGLNEGIVDSMEHSVFWILILAAKFSFSFYFQIMPRSELKAIWKLKRIDYDWLELFVEAKVSVFCNLFAEIDYSIRIQKFTEIYKTIAVQQIHAKLISLVDFLDKPKKYLNKLVNTLQALYEVLIRRFPKVKRTSEQLKEDGLAPLSPATNSSWLFENSIKLPNIENATFYRQVHHVRISLTSRDSRVNVPINLESRRHVAFFSNSLFVNIPHAPQVEKMMAFSVLTPYYNKEVLYNKEQLRTESEDGVSTLFYRQKIDDDEWINFLERMRRVGTVYENEIGNNKLKDLRFWASYRDQTLLVL
ncbi:hypothetical protein IFM89_009205 [Coptis chinensis]|uniref:Glycosyl transferase 48 domain-containing protein n=1 Tax=Coptis chinensis TaxID=261450 RepID=A0A835IX84_9MAGN|nr:hypothetical protein IFM89_009205 [Coptis chinensis]